MAIRIAGIALALSVAALAAACVPNPYEKFYEPMGRGQALGVERFAGVPRYVAGSKVFAADLRRLYTDGYGAIGTASFNGPGYGRDLAIAQAKQVGAEIVLVRRAYRNTETGVRTYQVPKVDTVTTTGAVGGDSFTGTSTVYGTRTEVVPYAVERYDYEAVFYRRLPRVGAGFQFAGMTDVQRRMAETNRGVAIVAVRRDSPAWFADIVPGDILLSVDGQPTLDGDSTRAATRAARGHAATYALMRNGTRIAKQVMVPEGTW